MTRREQIEAVLRSEDGYTDHPADAGGPTNCGITIPAWQDYCRATGRADWLRHPREFNREADVIPFYEWCWARPSLGLALLRSTALQYWLFDSSILFGPKRPVTWMQEVCNALVLPVKQDGILGPKTAASVNQIYPPTALTHLHSLRMWAHENAIRKRPLSAVFLRGWTARAERLKRECLEVARAER